MIDSHCHLDVAAFDGDRAAVIARATAAGVIGMLVPAIRPRTWAPLVELARAHAIDGVRIALGIHPQIVPALDDEECARGAIDVDGLAEILAAAIGIAGPHVIAVGECGLDGGTAEPERQQAILRAHVRAARAVDKPLVIHVLRAHDVAPRLLREERVHEVGGVLHSYSGGAALVPIYAELGLAFSFAGPVTYPNARRPLEAARAVPAALLHVETDAPDQTPTRQRSLARSTSAPTAHRGGRSEPAFLADIVRAIAAARGETAAAIAALTVENSRRLFRAW